MKNIIQLNLCLAFLFSGTCAFAQDYSTPFGEWRGQTQYQAFHRTVSDPAAHIITNLTIQVEPSGKVYGMSTENNCKMLGLASPGIAPFIVSLNLTLTGCKYAELNRTYQGQLSVFSKDKFAKFSLQAIDVTSGKAGTYNINATMRR
ncbi:MAG TPA: hypothetical protein PK702_05775 [Burkholderiaceae bacterium]|nr:hypothetical protein [Burkholderiaceae bacterium]